MNLTQKRIIAVFLSISVLLGTVFFRIYRLQNSEYAIKAQSMGQRSLLIGKSRGMIYDRNELPLVNDREVKLCAFLSTKQNYETVNDIAVQKLPEYKEGICVLAEVAKEAKESETLKNTFELIRYPNKTFCCHMLGYVNADGKGVGGIEGSFDRILSQASGIREVRYSANALEQCILGQGLSVFDDHYASKAGVILTLDKNIQSITERAMSTSEIKRGAAVVMEANTGEILASVSLPFYDRENLEQALTDENLPFLNRALCAYPVGSVFKPLVAACAIKTGAFVDDSYFCTGSITVSGTAFHCFDHNGHGMCGLEEAFCHSCNCYFIRLALNTGGEALRRFCEELGFEKELRLTGELIAQTGVLPNESTLNGGALANFSFGQGEFTATPLQLAAAYSALANGGIYHEPVLLKYLTDENGEKYAYYKNETSRRILEEGICEQIGYGLYKNMTEGTGVNGKPECVTSAGKTATAQTGDYQNGKERLCTWFCGYFPFENPRYTVVIMNENGTSASKDCAPVFKSIAEQIMETVVITDRSDS